MTTDPNLVVTLCLGIAVLGILAMAMLVGIRRRWRDGQRLFTGEQKRILLAQAQHRCEHKPLLWRRCQNTTALEADHVMPWSQGGHTELWNGQILCRHHNRRKSNVTPRSFYRWRLSRRRRKY